MDYYDLLDQAARSGLSQFEQELQNNPAFDGLLSTVIDVNENGVTEVVIETFDKDTYNTEFLTSFEFDESGNLID